MPEDAPLLEVRGIGKRFPGVRALHEVDLALHAGEVLAVVGENGAGKSTLMKILGGVQQPDEGGVDLEGRSVRLHSVREARRLGIALIHQELNLADNLDVAANIYLGREPRRGLGFFRRGPMERGALEILARFSLEVSPRMLVGELPIGQRQLVEIAKAVSADVRILIMDEPTSSISLADAARLFEVVRALQRDGVSIIYISHRLGEVREIADRVVVLRDGKNAGELRRDEISHDRIVRLMVGRDVSQFYARTRHELGDRVLWVRDLSTPAFPRHRVSFELRAGEVVGLAGLVGAGRTELLRSIFGVERPAGGAVIVAGERVARADPVGSIRAGLALVPEDRQSHGLILDMNLRQNVSLASIREHHLPAGLLDEAHERAAAARAIRDLGIRTPSARQMTRLLSGGNQQKVVLAKWLATGPRVLLLDEPTRGVDIGAKHEIYELIERLAARGMAILVASSEMEEILGISDRVLVMHNGRLAGELGRDGLTEEAVMNLATGRELAA